MTLRARRCPLPDGGPEGAVSPRSIAARRRQIGRLSRWDGGIRGGGGGVQA